MAKRKPMTKEQRSAAAERLRLAREKKNPPQYKNIHPDVLALPDDHVLSLKNVRSWIKSNKERLSMERREVRIGTKGAVARVASLEGYIRNMERYLRDGVWCDLFYGEFQQNKIKQKAVVMAYEDDGTPMRSHGVYYPDLQKVWNGEEEDSA